MSDEVMQDLDRLLRTGFTVAAQLAEQHRRGAAEVDRQRRDADVAVRQAAADEARAVQQAARAHYDKVGWADWRDTASLDDWAAAYQHAHAMRAYDPVAATAHNRIEDEVRNRYNVDIREALELHLQQVAEDRRIHAERDADHAADHAADHVVEHVVDSDQARSAAAGQTAGTGGVDPDTQVLGPGEVVGRDEMGQARASARDAGRGFGQQASDAVRQSRGQTTSGRRTTPGSTPRRGARQDADLTRAR